MHILFVTGTYYPSVNGVAIATKSLKSELEKQNHKVTVLAPKFNGTQDEPSVIRYPSLDNPSVKDFPIPLFPGVRSIYKLIESEKPDIVHAHHPFHVGYFARIIAKRYKIPLVFTYHTNYDVYAEQYAKFLPLQLKKKFLDNRIFDFCKKTDMVIFPSKEFKSRINKDLPFLNTVYLPSGVDLVDDKKNSKKLLKEKLSLPPNKTIILSVGRLSAEKNSEKMIEALSILPNNYFLVIAGDGPQRKKIKLLCSKLKVNDRVIFAGSVPHQEIADYYKAADIFLFTSKAETQGIVYLEAAYFGLPIVAVKSFAAKEWVKTEFGVVAQDNTKSIANAVISIDKKDKNRIRKAGRTFASKFTIENQALKIIEIYEELFFSEKL